MKKQKAQNIILTLSNGKKITATVPEFLKESDSVRVVGVEVTFARALPDGCHWETIERDEVTSP
jgi:hypothetical protein